jgi:hypothetical protein
MCDMCILVHICVGKQVLVQRPHPMICAVTTSHPIICVLTTVFSQAGGAAAAAEGGGGGEEEREEEEGGKSKGASSKEAKSDEFEPRAVEVRILLHTYYYICFLKVLCMCPHAT